MRFLSLTGALGFKRNAAATDLSDLSIRERSENQYVTPGQRLKLIYFLVRDQEVDGSNPFAPTIISCCFMKVAA